MQYCCTTIAQYTPPHRPPSLDAIHYAIFGGVNPIYIYIYVYICIYIHKSLYRVNTSRPNTLLQLRNCYKAPIHMRLLGRCSFGGVGCCSCRVSVCRCRGCCSLSVCVCVCDLLIFLYKAPNERSTFKPLAVLGSQ